MDIGLPELVIILVVVLVIFGPSRLTDIMGSLGKGVREFRNATQDKPTPPSETVKSDDPPKST